MPFTTGAGTIALATQRPASALGQAYFYAGASVAAVANALIVLVLYLWSDRVVALLGVHGSRVVSRLIAFILLCVGVQVISAGLPSLAQMAHLNAH